MNPCAEVLAKIREALHDLNDETSGCYERTDVCLERIASALDGYDVRQEAR